MARHVGANVVTVIRDAGQTWTEAILSALDERAAVVSVPNVHWTDGALIDLAVVAARAHELGARLVIDASQSLGAMPFNVAQLRPDFVVTVGYKWLLGPIGVGYLYVAEEHRHGEALEENWILRAGWEDFARLVDYRDEYQPGARRFDVGERTNFELMPMAAAALSQLLAWQVPNVAASLAAITNRIASSAADIGLDTPPASERGPHLLGIGLPDTIREQVLNTLGDANCFAAIRSGSLRIAPHLHITEDDERALLSALAKGPAGKSPWTLTSTGLDRGSAAAAVLTGDQPACCEGTVAVDMTATQIARPQTYLPAPPAGMQSSARC